MTGDRDWIVKTALDPEATRGEFDVDNNFVDIGPAGFSPGDQYVFSDRLFLASAPNSQLGTDIGAPRPYSAGGSADEPPASLSL
jgi:hypothetical protein